MSRFFDSLKNNSFALVLLPIIFIPAIFYSTTQAMVQVWMVNETFTHGFLVLPLVLWLLWQKRAQMLSIRPAPEPRAFLILLPLLVGWLVSAVVDVEVVQQFTMVTIILTSIWVIVGRQLLSCVFIPLLFLYFAVPFGQVFIPPLMEFTADFTVAMIKLVGIPVYRDGLSFILPTGSWSVVEECSGVRYLIASFLLGSIYAYLNFSSVKKRVFFILLSLIAPVIGNGLRAFGIVMIGHYSGMKLAIGADHLLYGWVFFGVIIFLLFYAGSFWRDTEASFATACEKEKNIVPEAVAKVSPPVFLAIMFLLVLSFSAFSNHIEKEKQNALQVVALQLPVQFSDWQYEADHSLGWQPVVVNPDAKISRIYMSAASPVQLDIAYYRVQRQGAEAVSSNNRLVNPYGGKWKLVSAASVVDSGKKFIESEVKYADKKLLVWHWYRVGRHETADPYIAKALEAYSLIIEGRSDAAMLSLATVVDDNKQAARQKLSDFWQKAAGDINNRLEQINDGK